MKKFRVAMVVEVDDYVRATDVRKAFHDLILSRRALDLDPVRYLSVSQFSAQRTDVKGN